MSTVLTGLVHITGEVDAGKSTMAYSACTSPDKISFFDGDVKAEAIDREIHFGVYHNLVRMFAKSSKTKPIDFHAMTIKLLKDLPDNKYELLVFDNWSQMEDGISDYGDEHILELSSLTPRQVKNMSALTWPYKYIYYAQVLDLMLSKAPLVILTTHIREKWIGQHKSGLMEPRGQRPLVEKSTLRLWLRHNPDGPEPIGLVLKRIAKREVTEEGIQTVSVLPRKIKPCTWQKIKWYMDNPIGNRQPTEEEMPNAFELSILDGTLTPDQKDSLRLARLAADDEGQTMKQSGSLELKREDSNLRKKIEEMKAEGLGLKTIADELGIGLGEILKAGKL